jgi:hypothetical protein
MLHWQCPGQTVRLVTGPRQLCCSVYRRGCSCSCWYQTVRSHRFAAGKCTSLFCSDVTTSGVHRIFFGEGCARNFLRGFNKFSWGQRAEGMWILGGSPPSQGFRSICKWVKPVLWVGCYGSIFHGTGNSAQLWQNFGILGRGVDPNLPPAVCLRWQHASTCVRQCFSTFVTPRPGK